ncbi:hypothetical protein [Streptomyces sp. NPDC052042]|uniref:hypothetical protein n=1 Tax=Streptomyces sp. NPDC052042 TaxID=3365683 RepID=UPI0037D8B559
MTDQKTTELYREHAKQAAVLDEAEVIGRFLDESPYVLAEYTAIDGYRDPQLVPVGRSIQQVLADFFGIDLQRIEAEKRQMLKVMSAMNSKPGA